MDRNDHSDAEETLNAYLHSYDGPQIQLWNTMDQHQQMTLHPKSSQTVET